MSRDSLVRLIRNELETDAVSDDCTTRLVDLTSKPARAVVFSKAAGVFSGLGVIQAASEVMTGKLEFKALVEEGAPLSQGEKIVELQGSAGDILSFERTLLNLLSHTCGIATQTRQFVDAAKPSSTRILATRKTLPGLRALQLDAVRAGGGFVHRRSLSDGVLIKDNHQAIAPASEWIRSARANGSPLHGIEVEVQDMNQLEAVLENKPDIIMLDNMGLELLEQAVKKIGNRARIEVSGGIQLKDVAAISKLGVHYISVGRLTHSVTALDLSLDMAL